MQPVIYTQRVEIEETYQERRDCADQRIAEFIHVCGFLPVPVPNKSVIAETFIRDIHPVGIILTGGNSLCAYGGNAPERDAMDEALLMLAVKYGISLYGFCRGMQSVLHYFGNELMHVEGHVAVRHMVTEKNNRYTVNSYHRQACMKLKEGCGLTVISTSEDGVIEAVRHEKYSVLATMWHPEREESFSIRDIERVKKLFTERIIM